MTALPNDLPTGQPGGKVKVVVKPALIVLILSIIIGIAGVVIYGRDPAPVVPAYGYINPETWRFETRQGAQALAVGGAEKSDVSKGVSEGILDAGTGFQVKVAKAGATPDSVYLRSALNLELNPGNKPLHLKFEARSAQGSDFPMTFTVRDSQTLLWSQRASIGTAWKEYDLTMQLKPSTMKQVIVAGHLGESTGTVQIRNLRLVN